VNWQTIWQQIEQKQLAPCYLLAGEESYLIYETVNRIEAALGLGQLRDINSDWLDAAHAHEGDWQRLWPKPHGWQTGGWWW
jgi:DNA polymerase III delta subunit